MLTPAWAANRRNRRRARRDRVASSLNIRQSSRIHQLDTAWFAAHPNEGHLLRPIAKGEFGPTIGAEHNAIMVSLLPDAYLLYWPVEVRFDTPPPRRVLIGPTAGDSQVVFVHEDLRRAVLR